jgi:FdhD protein
MLPAISRGDPPTKRLTVIKCRGGARSRQMDRVAEEMVLHVELGSGIGFDTAVSPSMLKQFVFGNLFSEGIISRPDEVTAYIEEKRGGMGMVMVRIPGLEKRAPYLKRNFGVIWADCGRNVPEYRRVGEKLRKRTRGFTISADVVYGILSSTQGRFREFQQTGGYHYAFLLDQRARVVARAPDVSRHNAVDKVIGREILRGKLLDERVLFVTGRIGMDIALKCIRCKIPLVVSRSAPLYQAVLLARKYNLGMVGFLRGRRFNIYSGEDIIVRNAIG